MSYSETIAGAIRDYLAQQGWTYDFDAFHGTLSVEAELSCGLGSALVVYRVEEACFLCYTVLPVNAPPEVRAQVGEYLHRANYGLPNGNFEFDYDDGSVHFKTRFDCPGGAPDPQQMEDSLAVGLTVADRYGDGLLTVLGDGISLSKRLIDALDGAGE